jgi:nitrite reductase/ring-hydroxylating ferredoxin subunit
MTNTGAAMTLVCKFDQLEEDSSMGFEVGDDSLFAVKKDGEIYLYRNSCPHLGVELNWMPDQFLDMEGQLIQCATHGALFLINNGECVGGPCQGDFLQAMPFEIKDGGVYLTELIED